MTFRQFGGLKYNTKHNAVSSNFNTSNNLVIREDAGISNNLKVTNNLLVQGNTDICGNLTAHYMFLSSGNNYSTESNSVVPKSYVDTIATGLHILKPVTCISTYDNSGNTEVYPVPIEPSNVTIYYNNGFVINGYSVQVGESVLLNDQGNYLVNQGEDVDNGVYDLSFNGNDYYFIRSSTELSLGSNAKGAYIKTTGGSINGGSGWVQVRSPAIVGIDPLLFYAFNPSTSAGYTPGIGLYTSQQGTITYLNVDSSLNFLTGIDASGGETLDVGTDSSILNLGSIDTSINIAGNPYVYTPYSLGSTFSPQVINISTSSNTTQITFTWTIPQLYQNISSSFQNINATLYANISGQIKTYPLITSSTMGINIITLNNIVITNQNTASGQSGNTFTYYNLDFLSMQDSIYNQLILWYSNYNPYPNVSYAGYSNFNTINPPSVVLFNSGETPTQNTTASVDFEFSVTNGKVTLQCYVQYIDYISLQKIGPPYITSYQIPENNYSSSGSNNRYGGAIQDSGLSTALLISTSTNADVNSSFEVSNMYPDSSYNFYIKAKNTNSGYGELGIYNYSTPAPSYPRATFLVPTPSLFNSTGKKYANSNATLGYKFVVNSLPVDKDIINYNNIGSGFVSDNIITAVQQSGIYGTNSTNSLLNVIASLGSVSTNVNVTSFGTGPIFTNTSGGITITAKTFDAYFKGDNYNQGFYLDCSTNMTITSSYEFYKPTSTLFTAALSCSGNNENPISNYSFYIDDINSNPIYTSTDSFTINSTSNYYSNQVSGIWVLNQSKIPIFSITNLKLNNMGNYFYASPLVNYTIGVGVSGNQQETNLSNVTSESISSGKFVNPIIINNNNVQATSVSSAYNTNISISITFNNLFGQNSQLLPSISVICDQPSYNLITNILATSIENLGISVGYKGYRVWSANVDSGVPNSGIMSPSGIVPYVFINNGATIPDGTPTGSTTSTSNKGYINVSYNNVWNISSNPNANQELLIANGNFTTNNTYYKNYTTFNGNGNLNSGYDYSELSGKKYATFAWNVSSITNVNYLNFVINFGTTNLYYSNANLAWYFNQSFTDLLELYYRFEYNEDVNQWGQYSNGNYYATTTWITINKQIGYTYSINNVTNPNNSNNVYNISGSLISPTGSQTSGNVTFKTSIPTIYLGDPNVATLYLRIGIPSGYNTFSNILAYVTAT
jgi:hypothetical protein